MFLRRKSEFPDNKYDPFSSFKQFGPGVFMNVNGELHYIPVNHMKQFDKEWFKNEQSI